ncbi:MAG: TonB-dependent receptor [Bacteroidota bacterium]
MKAIKNISLALFLFIASSFQVFAQQTATIYGKITDADKPRKNIEAVNISVLGFPGGTSSSEFGKYELSVPADEEITLVFSHIGFSTKKIKLTLAQSERYQLNTELQVSSRELTDVTIEDEQTRTTTLTRIDPKTISIIPTPSGGIEAIIKTLPGVSTRSELSSQYSVRGGNYDENLVYVNDIEIYRPFLIRSGQQEGLSFVNSDMVSSILFSAGGFDAKYGDKMSSVLDIKYRKPTKFAGSATMSLLGGAAHVEGVSKSYRLSYQLGIRQKSNRYILNSLNTEGDYKPSFTDFQGFITYDISDVFEMNILGNYARNKYSFVPLTRETDFGTINEALRLTIYFDGQEVDKFETWMGAISNVYKPNENLTLKFIASSFKTYESETFDIQGQYWIDELEKDMSKEEFGEVASNKGVGTYLTHARNYLDALVFSIEHKGYLTRENPGKIPFLNNFLQDDKQNRSRRLTSYMQWGIKYQNETINDQLNEWKMIDSAGYSLPHPGDSVGYPQPQLTQKIELQDVLRTKININSNRFSGYVQNNWTWTSKDTVGYTLAAGIRTNYWDLNKQLLFSPRISFSLKPRWRRDVVFRTATGYYHQPPFYRELRNLEGNLNSDLKAQQSIHFVIGSDYNFKAWNRPFKFISEIYYKHLENLVPYEIDNVRIRYYAENSAHGYATGIDMKVNGEFVKGIESWACLSVMQTQEDIENDFYYDYFNDEGEKIIFGYTWNDSIVDSIRYEPGYIPRLTDQRVNFSLFFQDYLPRFPNYKMHLNLVFGSRLPFGPPSFERYKDTLRIPPYRRVDIGFSTLLLSEDTELSPKNPFRHFESIWISMEVFNLLGINNTISYIWIKDITNREYAIPNYLTSRLLNVKVIAKF